MPASPATPARWPSRGGSASARSSPRPRLTLARRRLDAGQRRPRRKAGRAYRAHRPDARADAVAAARLPGGAMVSAIRVATEARPTMDAIWAALAAIPDPEIPVISLVELGIVRDVALARRPAGRHLDADLFGLPGDRGDRRRCRRGAWPTPASSARGSRRVFPRLDDRLDRARGEDAAGRVRHRAAGDSRGRAGDRHRRPASPRAARRCRARAAARPGPASCRVSARRHARRSIAAKTVSSLSTTSSRIDSFDRAHGNPGPH